MKLSRENSYKEVKTGPLGESIASIYLQSKGFSLVERNYLKPWGEIDIVAQKAGKTYFIEVKTVSREPGEGIDPAENLHDRKMQRLERAINSYIMEKKEMKNTDWQVDAILIHLNRENKKAKVVIVENIL